jgi:hypothetical protein
MPEEFNSIAWVVKYLEDDYKRLIFVFQKIYDTGKRNKERKGMKI